MDLKSLTETIYQTHDALLQQATKSMNICHTLRHWLIGYHIAEYELNGNDRAQYGKNVIEQLAIELKNQLKQVVTIPEKMQTLTAESIVNTPSPTTASEIPRLPFTQLFHSLSFTHFAELIKIDDPLKKSFYEIEAVRGNWSSRELKRQVGSLYFERSGSSKDKDKLASFVHEGAHQLEAKDFIRDPYVFEFLGIQPHDALRANNLRDALL